MQRKKCTGKDVIAAEILGVFWLKHWRFLQILWIKWADFSMACAGNQAAKKRQALMRSACNWAAFSEHFERKMMENPNVIGIFSMFWSKKRQLHSWCLIDTCPVAKIIQTISNNREWIQHQLMQHSALLFRGFPVKMAVDFNHSWKHFDWKSDVVWDFHPV